MRFREFDTKMKKVTVDSYYLSNAVEMLLFSYRDDPDAVPVIKHFQEKLFEEYAQIMDAQKESGQTVWWNLYDKIFSH